MNSPEPLQQGTLVFNTVLRRWHRRWLLFLVVLVIFASASAWLLAQGRRRAAAVPDPLPVLGTLTATPAHMVASTPTDVTFAIRIDAPTLKPTFVELQRVRANYWESVGRMYDDGKGADHTPGDHIYTTQVTLNEPQPGQLSFRATGNSVNILSESTVVDVWQHFHDTDSGIPATSYPPQWFALSDDTGVAFSSVAEPSPLSDQALQDEALFGILVLHNANPQQLPIADWFDQYFSRGFSSEVLDKATTTVAGRAAVRIELSEVGRRVHLYVPDGSNVLELTYGLTAPLFINTYESIIRSMAF